MIDNYIHKSEYFYGNKISDYGLANGRVDYRTLSKAFDAVLCNNIIDVTADNCGWDLYSGEYVFFENRKGDLITESQFYDLDEEEQNEYTEVYEEVYQWYIISEAGARILSELTNEIVYYSEVLDMYVWGVTHYGTAWDYVLTDIKIKTEE